MNWPKIVFVTGTDTDCGKTTIAVELLKKMKAQGLNTIGFKPIACGDRNDAILLQQHATIALPYEQVNPYYFAEPIAPHIAAKWHNTEITTAKLLQHLTQLQHHHPDVIVVEGAGGWRVPINESETYTEFVRSVNASVIIVVGVKLGCLNHATLTLEAVEKDQVNIFGWVANSFDINMPAYQENMDTLDSIFISYQGIHHEATSLRN